ncbi:hypothetical protein HU200_007987 [Digitaria exilis]|uniref:Uncharacterized protein n=1 Tax=Digitaria exilis TaxID=1010633 RepID=A0A835FNI3_9POAL|nr:hypothetical protein HU200_007987 [Digitaria exilis]
MHCKHCSYVNHSSGGYHLMKIGFSLEEAKKLVASTRAKLAQEAEQQAAQATINQQVDQEGLINNELRQEGQAESMTQDNTTLLSQMLMEHNSIESNVNGAQLGYYLSPRKSSDVLGKIYFPRVLSQNCREIKSSLGNCSSPRDDT